MRKAQIKRSTTLDFAGSEPDFMVFKRRGGVQTCHIVELKDGHVFDTKKASAERQAMHGFIERNAQHIQYRFQAHFCAFNQDDRQAIWNGFKRRIGRDEAMAGREFCDLLEIDYEPIVEARRVDCADNVEFLLSELLKIEPIRQRILEILGWNRTRFPKLMPLEGGEPSSWRRAHQPSRHSTRRAPCAVPAWQRS